VWAFLRGIDGGYRVRLSCRAETELRDMVLLAHGGSALGYALHLKTAA
jgi:hypothetical protein